MESINHLFHLDKENANIHLHDIQVHLHQFYINKYNLLRQFKDAYGLGIIAYYHALRIDYAKRKLSSTDLSITEIAKKLCFGDVYTFSRFFKSATNTSPREYRALCKKS